MKVKEDNEKANNYPELTYEKFAKIIGDFFYKNEREIPTVTVPKHASEIVLPSPNFKPEETESEFRARRTAELMEVVPHGCYDLGNGNIRMKTGRGGYIQFQVEMEWQCRNYRLIAEE